MKYNRFTKLSIFVLALCGFVFTACDESITIDKTDESRYETPEEAIGFIVNEDGMREFGTANFRDQGLTNMFVGLTKEAAEDASFTLKYDPEALKAYNQANESNYAIFPQALVTLPESFSVSKGSKKSVKAEVKFTTGDALEANTTYVIPLKAESKSGSVKLSEKESSFLLFVKDFTKLPDTKKSTGIEIISCMEVNDTNPLNNLCFTLKNSGKYLVDMVILFSANINYNNETGKVYVYNNPNVQHLLNNREKYLQPLQDAGMKVVLGILGNHDRAGVANLADETARAYAQELKSVCEAYNLDGVFFDDEYTAEIYPAPPGFVGSSSAAASRLCYETKKAMPDKLVTVYVYSSTSRLPEIDGVESGKFVDYGIHDYGAGYDLSSNYPGMPKNRMALYSQEFNRGYWASEYSLKDLRTRNGAHMIFAMNPNRSNFTRGQIPAMQRIAEHLFDDELVYDGKPYKKDW